MKVAVVKYNAGNIRSVDYALKRLGVEAVITADKEILHRPFYHYRQSNPESLTKIYSQEHIIQVANNVYEVEKYVNASAYADSLIEFIPFLKLNIKLPLLITDDKSHYEQWLECFPEANCYVMNNKLLPLRTRIIQWMAVKRYFILLRLYYRTVFKLVYGIIYK